VAVVEGPGKSPRNIPEKRGATTCIPAACLIGGTLVLGNQVVDLGGLGVGLAAGNIRRRDGRWESGYGVLLANGVVVHAPDSLVPEDPQLAVFADLPPISRLFRGILYQDNTGAMWFAGPIEPQRFPADIVAGPVTTTPCTYYAPDPFKPREEIRTCTAKPLELAALRGTEPALYGDVAFGLYPDGRLVCWPYANGTCPLGEDVLSP
jgi:hypothetical protein